MKNLVKYILIIIPIICIVVFFITINKKDEIEVFTADPQNNVEIIKEELEKNTKRTPKEVKAIYLSAPYLSNDDRLNKIITLTKETEINAVIIDVKDFSGKVWFNTDLDILEKYANEQKWIDIDYILEKLHENNIYTIARIVVFEDVILATNRNDLAIKDKTGNIWKTSNNLAWVDPYSKEVWDYNINIALEAAKKGFNEINFDYVRFPSDGILSDAVYPFFNNETTKREVIKGFFKYIDENLKNEIISIDLFGLTTVAYDDIGIGQVLEDALIYFDYVCPMVYPSHYANGFRGLDDPNAYPYDVVLISLSEAEKRDNDSKLRPWLQNFYNYTENEVKLEIQAVKDALQEKYIGYMLWNASNIYTIP